MVELCMYYDAINVDQKVLIQNLISPVIFRLSALDVLMNLVRCNFL